MLFVPLAKLLKPRAVLLVPVADEFVPKAVA